MTPAIPKTAPVVGVGTPEYASKVLTDLYVTLRRNLQLWAAVTHQTPQPRMGYVGQHLVSAVTGYPGGRSGARGDDLKLPNGKVGEIKCCYRVDQLGSCAKCGTVVASIEKVCPNEKCGSKNITRKDDSKWLLSPKSEEEVRELFIPLTYYLVLFEFADLNAAGDINVQILEVDPNSLGFSLCMLDYYFNIRSKSISKAPFNMWPASFKLHLMKAKMIYWSVIGTDDTITTKLFPGRDKTLLVALAPLGDYSGATTLTNEAIDALAKKRGITVSSLASKADKLATLQAARVKGKWSDDELADDLARIIYGPLLKTAGKWTAKFAPTL